MPLRENISVRVTNGFVVTLAILTALCGIDGSLAILFASLIHELAHWLAIILCRGRIVRIACVSGGFSIHADGIRGGYGGELLCLISGAAANIAIGFLLANLCAENEYVYILAGANFASGLFNLIPAGIFDGGRILDLAITYLIGPRCARNVYMVVSGISACVILIGGSLLYLRSGGNLTVLLTTLYLSFLLGYDIIVSFLGYFRRSRPSTARI
ncbi:MAG: hypothetical protein IKU55_03550 [Clostridia bacterium]|nr:hypothetical protein [Clostridia bacterium]